MKMDLVPTNFSFSPFRVETIIDDHTAVLLYKGIYECLELIKSGETHKLSFEFLYRTCYRLTINNYGGMLYGGVLDFIIEMLGNKRECESMDEIIYFWKTFETTMDTLHDILMYLEKNFITSNTKVPIKITGMAIFMKYYLFSNNRFAFIINNVLEQINTSRKSRQLNINFSKDIRFIVEKILSLPSIEISIKSLPIDTIDTIKFNETCCHHSIIEKDEFISFKSRIPTIHGVFDSKILMFTYKFNQKAITFNWKDLTIFNKFFMPSFIIESQKYHKSEFEILNVLDNHSILGIINYLNKCEKTYLFEKTLVENFLVIQVWDELIKEMDKIWIYPFFERFSIKTIFEFFSSGNKSDLQQLFRILSRVPECLDKLRNSLKQFFSMQLDLIFPYSDVLNNDGFNQLINEIQLFKNRSEFIFIECFKNNSMFNQVISLSFEDFFHNRDAATIINLIVTGFDIVLRSFYISNQTNENANYLESLFWLFKYISNKNLFEVRYRTFLCRRLMEFTTNKRNMEHDVITRLRGECGHGYTLKLEGVLEDITQSEILSTEFNKGFNGKKTYCSDIIINYNVITPNFWIIHPLINASLLRDINRELDNFAQFFYSKYERRKLQWHHGAGSAIINVKNTQCKSFLIECSTIQMLILDIFNTYDYISFEEMQKIIGCSDINFLKNNLLSLVFENELSLLIIIPVTIWRGTKINHDYLNENKGVFELSGLNIDPRNYYSTNNLVVNSISSSDIICINNNVNVEANAILKYKYDFLDYISDVKQSLETESYSIQDKAHIIDSIIVKILKKNKTLHVDDITRRVIDHNSILFKENTELIIERLEILCQKEFVSKDLRSQNLYNYIP